MTDDPNTATVPNVTAPIVPVEAKPVEFATMVPAEYKDKPYMKDITSVDNLFKQFDNAQTMIGQKPSGIPQDTDSQEKFDAFYKSLGRPDKAEEYDLGTAPEGMTRNEEVFNQTKALLHTVGLSAKQAKSLQEGYEKLVHAQTVKVSQAQDTEFDAISKTHFGDRMDAALENSSKLMKELAPKEFATHIAGLDNKTLLVVSSVLDAVQRKYISSDSVPTTKDAERSSVINLRAEGMKLMGSKAWKDAWDPEHKATRARVKEIYSSLPT